MNAIQEDSMLKTGAIGRPSGYRACAVERVLALARESSSAVSYMVVAPE